ncbi:MAG: NDP-sugar synthase [Chloroflexi bacterium]|nr:NDP-sugar synthase [Chloroflexota bacterium]
MKTLKAVILVGGEGTRLRPLTYSRPKPMVPVAGRPLLEHVIERLARYGVREVVLALGYLPDAIRAYFGDGSSLGIALSYEVEEKPLGTAGAVRRLLPSFDGSFLVLNGDILMEVDIAALVRRHHEKGAVATLTIHEVEDPRPFGLVEVDEEGRVVRFLEKPKQPPFPCRTVNSGLYVLEPEALSWVEEDVHRMFETDVFPSLLARREKVCSYLRSGPWRDIGTPSSYLAMNMEALGQEQGLRSGEGSRIHSSAEVKGPVLLGRGCRIEKDATLRGPVVLGDGCIVEEGARVERSVLWERVRVGRKAHVVDAVLADGVVIEPGVALPPGTVLGSGESALAATKSGQASSR